MNETVSKKSSKVRHQVRTPTRMFNSYITVCNRHLREAFGNDDKPLCKQCARVAAAQ